jgi:hypothetical protein
VPLIVTAPGRRLVTLVVLLALSARPLAAQPAATAAALKAAFLVNFAKFAEWPADALAPGQRLALCVAGDTAVADALELIIKRRAVEGHELTVQVVKPDGPLRACHLLYVGGLDNTKSARLIETLHGAPVFSVSDAPRFAEAGGVAQLILEDNRMRFAINVAAAREARLHISANLLSLATIIRETRHGQP